MASLPALRKEAKALGISIAKLREATSASELKALIAEAQDGKPRKARKAVRKATKASRSRTATTRKASAKSRPARKAPAAKSTTGKAKRPSTTSGKSGRNLLGSVDFNKTKGWSPRAGSAPDRIIKALKKARGNRESAFNALRADVWDFVGKVRRNGEKRTKAEAEAMLRYRISRTLFDFACQTGQHKVSTNRIQYGTGPHAQNGRKTRRKATAKAKPAAKRGRPARKPAAKRGRKARR